MSTTPPTENRPSLQVVCAWSSARSGWCGVSYLENPCATGSRETKSLLSREILDKTAAPAAASPPERMPRVVRVCEPGRAKHLRDVCPEALRCRLGNAARFLTAGCSLLEDLAPVRTSAGNGRWAPVRVPVTPRRRARVRAAQRHLAECPGECRALLLLDAPQVVLEQRDQPHRRPLATTDAVRRPDATIAISPNTFAGPERGQSRPRP